ncbi:hypothetical protein LshimejAT787_1500830 [Lyophyllum shimeji]|uniref:Uncharacterized protein n=1 Tax=Lyophyllum shimeji TaxID=47721 RepID=A0A9P3UQG2_LYOSH|nr:hypothetical protein LshimejAT787_1500830 [Lyophyllum shimeji]
MKSPSQKGPPLVWELAAQFFIHQEPETVVKPVAMDVDQSMPEIQTTAKGSKDTGTTGEPVDGTSIRESIEDDGNDEDEADEAGNSDEDGYDEAHDHEKDQRWKPPTIEAAHATHMRIKAILHPQQHNGIGHKDAGIDLHFRSRHASSGSAKE